MRISTLTFSALLAVTAVPAFAQQTSPAQVQEEADKGIKTKNSGASGVVGDQKAGSDTMPGQMGSSTTGQPSAQNSGTGVSGAPGGKNGPPASSATTGSNQSVQQQDSSGIKGLPGNKSGPPAKK